VQVKTREQISRMALVLLTRFRFEQVFQSNFALMTVGSPRVPPEPGFSTGAISGKVGKLSESISADELNMAADRNSRSPFFVMQPADSFVVVGEISGIIEVKRTGRTRPIVIFVRLPQKVAHRAVRLGYLAGWIIAIAADSSIHNVTGHLVWAALWIHRRRCCIRRAFYVDRTEIRFWILHVLVPKPRIVGSLDVVDPGHSIRIRNNPVRHRVEPARWIVHRYAPIWQRHIIVIIQRIAVHSYGQLFHVADTCRAQGLSLSRGQRRQKQGGQNGDDRNDNEKLD